MKILFLITASGKKSGGHMFSLYHIAHEIAKTHSVRIISFGEEESVVYSESSLYLSNCKISSLKDLLNLNSRLIEKLNGFEPDIVHSFDDTSFLLSANVKIFRNSKLVFTKCGGMNPKGKKWIYADNLVLFSKENYTALKSMEMYKKASLNLIPNRVKRIQLFENNQLTEVKDNSCFNFVRISRIGLNYVESTKSLFKLVSELPVFKKKYRIYIIGRIENETKYLELVQLANDMKLDVRFITDARTQIASQMLYLADCVLGTGRSLMEAMSLGIPVLTPLSNSKYPTLVSSENFDQLLNTNFSERNIEPEDMQINAYDKLIKCISDKVFYNEISKGTQYLFDARLSVEEAIPQYEFVYQNALIKKESRMAYYNWFYFLRMIKNLLYA